MVSEGYQSVFSRGLSTSRPVVYDLLIYASVKRKQTGVKQVNNYTLYGASVYTYQFASYFHNSLFLESALCLTMIFIFNLVTYYPNIGDMDLQINSHSNECEGPGGSMS